MADQKPPIQGYSLWLEASEQEHQMMQVLIDELAQQYNTLPFRPHLTLIGLLEKRQSDLDDVKQGCEHLARSFGPMNTEIIGPGARGKYFQSVFMPVVPTQELVAINQEARQLFGHQADPPYMPHWSAIYGDLSKAKKRSAMRHLTRIVPPPYFLTVNTLTLVDVHGYPNEWHVVETYPLSDKA